MLPSQNSNVISGGTLQKTYHTIHAFVGASALGNAAVVFDLSYEPEDRTAKDIMEKEQASVAVFCRRTAPHQYAVRSLGKSGDIQFCGHGSLALAAVLLKDPDISDSISLKLPNRKLTAKRDGKSIELSGPMIACDDKSPQNIATLFPDALACLLGNGTDIIVLRDKDSVKNFKVPPSYNGTGFLAVTAAEGESIFSRFFEVKNDEIREDPATGSLHFILIPYWAKKLKHSALDCYQLSERGGFLRGRYKEGTVSIIGDTHFLD